MNLFLFSILLLTGLYLAIPLAYLFFSRTDIPYKPSAEIDRSIFDFTSPDLAAAEARLAEQPSNVMLRLSILKQIYIDKRSADAGGPGLAHAKWILENAPEYAGTIVCRIPFFRLHDEEKAREIENILNLIEAHGRTASILRTFSELLTHLNNVLSVQLAGELNEKQKLSPDSLYRCAYLRMIFGDVETPRSAEWATCWSLYRRWLKCSWSERDFWKFEKLQNQIGKSIWPYPIRKLLLTLKGELSTAFCRSRKGIPDYVDAGAVALFAGETIAAKKIARLIKRDLVEFQKECAYPQQKESIYIFFARLAVAEGNEKEILENLRKKEEFELESEFHILSRHDVLLNDLLRSGRKDAAYSHMKTISRNIAYAPRVQRCLELIQAGELITAKRLT